MSQLATSAVGVTPGRIVRSEWMKLRTVWTTQLSVLFALLVPIVFAPIFSASGDGAVVHLTDSLSLSLAGFSLNKFIAGVFGVTVVANEYTSGLIRTTFQSVRTRTSIVYAKMLIVGLTMFTVSIIAAPTAFFLGKSAYKGTQPAFQLADPGVVRALGGYVLYTVCVSIMGVAIGFLTRSATRGIVIFIVAFILFPRLFALIPLSITKTITKLLPSNAGEAATGITHSSKLLSPFAGALVLILWTIGLIVVANLNVRRRDA